MRTEINTLKIKDSRTLANLLTGRYGVLALTRAAGAAAAAERLGDREQTCLWQRVIVDLRQEIATPLEA